ncbi:MAG TPA: hypothetical protein VFM62_01955 [Arthrobacter sp.]|nr:hypothetical protein [Arthrobacter sp.]
MNNFPAKEPRFDHWVSEATGETVEELSGISATQPYISKGPWLSSAGWELLVQLAERHRLGRFDLRGNPTAVQDLVEAGVITPKGRLTDEGEFLVSPLRDIRAVISLSARHGRHSSGFRVHLGATRALIGAGPSYHSLLEPDVAPGNEGAGLDDGDSSQLELAENAAVPEMIGRWMGLGPAWSIAMLPEQLPTATLEARFLDDMAPAPAAADERFLRMWHEPWVVFTLDMSPGDFRMGLISAGAAGFYSYGGAEAGQVQLQPLPSGQLWSTLLMETARAVHGGVAGR